MNKAIIPIVSVVGYSGSGKTTLIERLIPKLKDKGYKVGTIKHDAHEFQIDHEGKDTWRMSEAGSDGVVISSGSKIAMIKPVYTEINLDEIADWLLSDMDIIIAEGYRAYNQPKIEVLNSNEIKTDIENNLIALINNFTDKVLFELPLDYRRVPLFQMSDLDLIAAFIEKRFLKNMD